MNRLPEIVSKLSKLGNDNHSYRFYRDFLDRGYSCEDIDDDNYNNCPGYRLWDLFHKFEKVSLNETIETATVEWIFNIPDCDNQLSIKEVLVTKKAFFGRKFIVGHFDKRNYKGTHVINGDFDNVDIQLIHKGLRINGKVLISDGQVLMQDSTSKATKIVRDFLCWLDENKDIQPDVIKINNQEWLN